MSFSVALFGSIFGLFTWFVFVSANVAEVVLFLRVSGWVDCDCVGSFLVHQVSCFWSRASLVSEFVVGLVPRVMPIDHSVHSNRHRPHEAKVIAVCMLDANRVQESKHPQQ